MTPHNWALHSAEFWKSGWDAGQMAKIDNWKIPVPRHIGTDIERLANWARNSNRPLDLLQRRQLDLPAVRELGAEIATQIEHGSGVAWVRDVPEMPGPLLSLLFLSIGLELGNTLDIYGRLYQVIDQGGSYRSKPIPVSQTRESTGMHTDSSNKDVWPHVVGLTCVQPAPQGGGSRIVSSTRIHEILRANFSAQLNTLYGNFIRDVVTPGHSRNPARVRRNTFPIFTTENGVAMRYMRYWIEKGHERSGISLTTQQIRALDVLDEALEDPAHTVRFQMKAGEMLFVDNTRVAHDRDSYLDAPHNPRRFLRVWIDRPRRESCPSESSCN